MEKKRPKSANKISLDDVKTTGGKDLILNRMVNHYKALANVKSKVEIQSPSHFFGKTMQKKVQQPNLKSSKI